MVDFTIEALRDAIRSGVFAPGQRLIVADITRMLSVSAGPVREAIRRLTGEGLIEITPHRGASVRKVTRDEIREIQQLRAAIEGMAAGLAAERSAVPALRTEMLEIREEMDRCAANDDKAGFIDNNQRFHDLILRTAGNQVMKQMAQQLVLPLYQFRLHHRMTLADMRQSYAAHQRVIAAILSGKTCAADQAMRDHILESGLGLVAAIDAIDAARPARDGASARTRRRAAAGS